MDEKFGTVHCPDCGGTVSIRAKACPHCGGPVPRTDPRPADNRTPRPWLYVVPALVLIMAVAVVGVWLTNRAGAEGASISESSPPSTPSNTPASSTNTSTPPPASLIAPTNA